MARITPGNPNFDSIMKTIVERSQIATGTDFNRVAKRIDMLEQMVLSEKRVSRKKSGIDAGQEEEKKIDEPSEIVDPDRINEPATSIMKEDARISTVKRNTPSLDARTARVVKRFKPKQIKF